MSTPEPEGSPDEEIPTEPIATQDDAPLAAALVSEVLNLSVQRVTPLLGLGSVNLIFFVETSAEEIVVRLNKPQDDTAKARREYEKERWCITHAAMAGIPGPEVRAVGEHSGRAFLLQNRVTGVNGRESDLLPTDLMRILGQYARRIHTLPANGFGDSVDDFESGRAQEGWFRFVDYNLGELTASDPLIALGVYTPQQQDAIRALFTGLRRLPLRVGLNHGDLARRNTIVDESGRVTLLDWGCAEMNIVPHYELNALCYSYPPDHPRLRAFLEGYGMSDEEWGRFQPEMNAFMLLKAFDLTRWAIDRSPANMDEYAERARSCVVL
jgi:aminoglycoside phosphotransferase (APT) family kinase protein